jgi:hypothetical protein
MMRSPQAMSAGVYNTVAGTVAYRGKDTMCKNHAHGLLSGQVEVAADYYTKHHVFKQSKLVKLVDGCLFQ